MIKNYNKLSRKLSRSIVLMAAPIFLLSLGALFLQSRYLIHREVSDCTNSMLETTLHRVRNYMCTIETATNSNLWMLEANFRPDSLQSVSNRIVRLNSNVISSSVFAVPDMFKEYGHRFSIYTVNLGDTVVTYCEPEYDYLDKVCYNRPLNSGNACWVYPFVDNTNGKVDHNEAIATYCRPIKQQGGRIVGVVTADFSFSRLAKMLNEIEHPYPNAFYILLGGDGRYLMHPDTTRLFRKTIFTDADPSNNMDIITLGHEMTSGKQGTIHVHENGKKYHVSYMPVPETNWSLALVCPDRDAMKGYYHLGYIIIVLLIIGMLVIFVLSYRVVRQTVAPINQLLDTTQKIAEGQYDETIPATRHHGIVGRLQNSFATMQQALKERMGSLQQKADELRRQNEETSLAKQQAEDTVSRKHQFIQRVTQQMRMPLNVLMGFAKVMGESSTGQSVVSEEEQSSISRMMKDNVISMKRMLLMLFDAAEMDATETLQCDRLDEVQCNAFSQECINYMLTHFPDANMRFESELQDGVCILTNKNYLMRIMRVLLYNSAKYSDRKHIVLRVTQTETAVRFTIEDTGPGLPADLPDLMIEPFTKHPEEAGWGLPFAKRFAVGLGGDLMIDTDYHEGCRMVIEMPK